jgi:hypothetical protein
MMIYSDLYAGVIDDDTSLNVHMCVDTHGPTHSTKNSTLNWNMEIFLHLYLYDNMKYV